MDKRFRPFSPILIRAAPQTWQWWARAIANRRRNLTKRSRWLRTRRWSRIWTRKNRPNPSNLTPQKEIRGESRESGNRRSSTRTATRTSWRRCTAPTNGTRIGTEIRWMIAAQHNAPATTQMITRIPWTSFHSLTISRRSCHRARQTWKRRWRSTSATWPRSGWYSRRPMGRTCQVIQLSTFRITFV